MNRARQRSVCAAVVLFVVCGCQARSSVEAAQTAVVAVQTVLPSAQSALTNLQVLLGGASLEVKTSPEGAANDAITEVSIYGTDTHGTLRQLDPEARRAAASAALLAASQYYPNAAITLTVADGAGQVLLKGSKAPGDAPVFQ